MLIENKKIAIIGGGPGGLTLATLLQQKGADVKVYERDAGRNVRVQGATLDLHQESGLEALRRAGIIDAFYASYRPKAGRLRIMDKYGNIKFDDHAAEGIAEDRPEIDRGPLREILLNALQQGTVVWDSHFAGLQPLDGGWMISFKNGATVAADIVIAADGANSQVRPYITGIKPIYSGITVVEGNIYNAAINAPKLYKLVNGGKVFALGDDQSLILSAKGDGSLSFYTGCLVDELWVKNSGIDFNNRQQVFDWFTSAFGAWDSSWQELFAGSELWCIPRPQYHFPLDQCWPAKANITMIGDAAHRMPPYAGEGVNMAMQDAFELAECLTGNEHPDVQTAIASFEQEMCRRAAEVTKITLESTEMMHSGDPVTKLINMFSAFDGDNDHQMEQPS